MKIINQILDNSRSVFLLKKDFIIVELYLVKFESCTDILLQIINLKIVYNGQ